MRAERDVMRHGALVVAALALLGGCAAELPRVPPSELLAFESSVTIDTVWSTSLDVAGRGRFEPLIDDGSVTLADRDGIVTRLDRASGKRMWRVDTDARLVSGVGGDATAVYVAADDGAVLALVSDNGAQRWRSQVSSEVLAPVSSGFGTLVVRSADGRVVSLDPATGAERWSNSWTPPALTVNGYGRPLMLDGGVLLGLDDGRLLALDSSNGREIWETQLTRPSGRSEVERLADIDADVLIDDAAIYVVNFQGRIARVEPARGQIVWGKPMSSTAGLAQDAESLFVVDEESAVHALDKRDGRTLWRQDALRGRKLGTPARIGDVLLVGDFEGYLHALDANDGSIVGRARPAKSAIRVRPAGDASNLVVQATGGRVSALRLGSGG